MAYKKLLCKGRDSIFVITNSPLFVLQHLQELIAILSINYRVVLLSGNDIYASQVRRNCELIGLPIRRNPSLSDPLSAICIMLLRLHHRPKLVISFTPKGGLLNLMTCILPGKSIHYFTGQRWSTLSGKIRKLLMFIDRQICLSMHETICDSKSQALFIENMLSVNQPIVINNGSIRGVNHLEWRPLSRHKISKILDLFPSLIFLEKRHEDDQNLLFGYVGRICNDKGVHILLESFAIHLRKFPDSKLLLVGPVEEKGDLFNIINNYPKNIYHVDYTIHVNKLMPFLSALILPSYREGFGSVILEAAACKVPSIVTNIPGPIDFVTHKENGYIVPKGDVSALANVLDMIGYNPNQLKILGQFSFMKSLKYFKSEDVSNELASFLIANISE